MEKLPELPEPDVDLGDGFGKAFSDDALADYGRECARMAREEAAKRVSALAQQSRGREEVEVIGRCWDAIVRG